MNRPLMRSLCAALALVPGGTAALAQAAASPPDLTGTWTGVATAVSVGENPYRPKAASGAYFSDDEITFTFNIAEQHDGRFSGSVSAGDRTETVIGGLRPPDYAAGVFLDDDGRYEFTVRDGSTIDLCYDHAVEASKVVACYTLKKQ